MTSLPPIAPPRWNQGLYVNPSARDNALGALLVQKDDGLCYMRPIYFAIQVMIEGEKNYSQIEKAVCALMSVTTRFHYYLLPQKFIIISIKDTFPYALHHMGMSTRVSK